MIASSLLIADQQTTWQPWGWIALKNLLIILVGISCWFLGLIGVAYGADHLSPSSFRDVFNAFAVLVAPNLLAGAVVGLAQWAWLWRRQAPLGMWVLLSVTGWMLDFAVHLSIPMTSDDPLRDTLYIVGSRTGIGISIGFGQWLLLRKHIYDAGWWIPISAGTVAIAWLGFLSYF
jgi:hypothetical protein